MKNIGNWKQEKEYRNALEAFNDKNKEKVQLITRLMEVSTPICQSIMYRILNPKMNLITVCLTRSVVETAGKRKREIEDEEAGGVVQEHRTELRC